MRSALPEPDSARLAITRLASLSPLDPFATGKLHEAAAHGRPLAAGRQLLREGRPIAEAELLLAGWAARVRQLEDGRRQVLNFVLPGDPIGLCDQDRPIAAATVVALTAVTVCPAPDRGISPALDHAYAVSRAFEEAYLLAQITRLGRLSAFERIIDLLLELHDRLERIGLTEGGRFHLPLTQEMLADALGLTSVHVNRMLQQARRSEHLAWSGRQIVLHDLDELRRTVGRQPVQVMAAAG